VLPGYQEVFGITQFRPEKANPDKGANQLREASEMMGRSLNREKTADRKSLHGHCRQQKSDHVLGWRAAALCTVAVWRKERETKSVRAFIAACGKPAKID
jgi:hypothetical protein